MFFRDVRRWFAPCGTHDADAGDVSDLNVLDSHIIPVHEAVNAEDKEEI